MVTKIVDYPLDSPDPPLSNPALVSLTKKQMISELHSLGFFSDDISRVLKTRPINLSQGNLSKVSRVRLEKLLEVCWRLQNDYAITQNVAGWLEAPIHEWAPISPFDMIVAQRDDLVLTLAENRDGNAESVLDQFEPEWRDKYNDGLEVFIASDGYPGIRAKYGWEQFMAPDGKPGWRPKPAPR